MGGACSTHGKIRNGFKIWLASLKRRGHTKDLGTEGRLMAIIALMMEAARTSETSVDNYFTRKYIPEDKSELNS
jgi:hypothetical protein